MPPAPALPLPTVIESLRALTVEQLKWYASVRPGSKPTRKEELIAFLLPFWTDHDEVRWLWERLSAVEQHIVSEVIYRLGGRYDSEMLRAKYPESVAPQLPSSYYGYSSITSRTAPPSWFQFLFRYDYSYGTYIPADLADLLRTIAPPPPPTALASHDAPPFHLAKRKDLPEPPAVTVSEPSQAIFHDLLATLTLVQEGKLSVSATTRQPGIAAVRALRQRLLLADYLPDDYERAEDAIRPFALIMLVQAAKWAVTGTDGAGKLVLTKAGQQLTKGGLTATHIRLAWEAWVKTPLLDELSRIRGIKGQGAKGVRLTKPAERRALLRQALQACPPGRWVALRDFSRYLRAERLSPTIERGQEPQLSADWYYDYTERGSDDSTYWEVIIGSYLRVVLWEYAATLGLLDVAYTQPGDSSRGYHSPYGAEYFSRYDGLLALRLTALGAYALGLTDEYTPPAASATTARPLLMLLPNLDIVVTDAPRLAPNDRAFLERLGSPQTQDVYKLDRERLLDLIEGGIGLRQVREFLATRSGIAAADFPQPMRVFLSDLEQRLTALREGGRVILLESADPILLTELAHDSALRGVVQLVEIAGRTALLVPEPQEAAIWRRLKQLGYLPARRG